MTNQQHYSKNSSSCSSSSSSSLVVVVVVVVLLVVVVVVVVVVPTITIHGQYIGLNVLQYLGTSPLCGPIIVLNSNIVVQIQFPENFQSFKFKSSQQVTGACVKPTRKTVKYWVDLSSALGLVERKTLSNLTRQWVDKG